REKEEELVFRGQQYVHAITLFSRKNANAFPPNLNVLVEQRFLRKKFKDPITNGDFQPIPAGQQGTPGIAGPPQSGQRQAGPGPGGRDSSTTPATGGRDASPGPTTPGRGSAPTGGPATSGRPTGGATATTVTPGAPGTGGG